MIKTFKYLTLNQERVVEVFRYSGRLGEISEWTEVARGVDASPSDTSKMFISLLVNEAESCSTRFLVSGYLPKNSRLCGTCPAYSAVDDVSIFIKFGLHFNTT